MPEAPSRYGNAVARLLFQGLCTAGAVVAPTLTLSDPTIGTLLLGLGAGALNVAGAWRVNTATQDAYDRERARLPDDDVLLRNGDLALLIGEALKRTLESVARESPLARKELLEALAKEVPAHLRGAIESGVAARVDDALPNIAVWFAQYSSERAGAPDGQLPADDGKPERDRYLDDSTWATLLREFAARARVELPFAAITPELLTRLDLLLARFVVEVFKEDATGRGPAGGRGWAALTLCFWGRLTGDLRELRELVVERVATSSGELHAALAEVESRVTERLDRLVRWLGPPDTRLGTDLHSWLRTIDERLATKVDDALGVVGHGLVSPEAFRLEYWHRRRLDPGLERVWADAARAEVLTQQIVGRRGEIGCFEEFLRNPSVSTQFWRGWPGTGKSRLAIAFAERATALGHRVFFVSDDVHDLRAALLRLRGPDPVVLIWDDYKGDHPEALRVFLTPMLTVGGTPVKRVITAWPSHNVLGEKTRDPLYEERELSPLAPSEDLILHTRRLVPTLSREDTETIVAHAGGHPEAVLRAVELILRGARADQLPANLIERAYDDLIVRVLGRRPLAEVRELKRALLSLALVGVVNLGDPRHRAAFETSGITDEALGTLVQLRTIAREQETYSLSLDGFRAHVVRRSLDHRHVDVLSGTPAELGQLAAPLLPAWPDAIWGMSILATETTDYRGPLQEVLLQRIDELLRGVYPYDALRMAQALLVATLVDPDPRRCEDLADRIAYLLARRDDPELAVLQARALMNATVDQPDSHRREALASRIGLILDRHDTRAIALEQAKALFNATVDETDPRRCQRLAEQILALLVRHHDAEIALKGAQALIKATAAESDPATRAVLADRIGELCQNFDTVELTLEHARGLANATVGLATAAQCEVLIDRIAALLARVDHPAIALSQARALHNATMIARDPAHSEALADRIARLRTHQDTPEIALWHARALVNTMRSTAVPGQRERLTDRIEEIVARHDRIDIAVQQATALFNATVGQGDAGRQEALACRIAQLLARYDSAQIARLAAAAFCNASVESQHDPERCVRLAEHIADLLVRYDCPEIALRLSQTLANASVAEPDGSRCAALAERIEVILARHSTVEIAGELARALYNPSTRMSTRMSTSRDRETLADRIGALLGRHDDATIALYLARTLLNTTLVEPNPRQRARLADRIRDLKDRHDSVELDILQALALANATVDETDQHECERLAERIDELLARHDHVRIATAEAQALMNASAAPGSSRRDALAFRIAGLLARHDVPDIAFYHAAALFNAALGTPGPQRWESVADEVSGLLARHATVEIAQVLEKTLSNAMVSETDAGRKANFRRRIDALRIQFRPNQSGASFGA